jgi:hypothetical protein
MLHVERHHQGQLLAGLCGVVANGAGLQQRGPSCVACVLVGEWLCPMFIGWAAWPHDGTLVVDTVNRSTGALGWTGWRGVHWLRTVTPDSGSL